MAAGLSVRALLDLDLLCVLLPCGEWLYKLLGPRARQQMSTYFMRICLHWILVLGMHWCTYLAYSSYLNYLVCLVTQKPEGFTPCIRLVSENVWSMGVNPCMIWACVYLNNLVVACISQPISTKYLIPWYYVHYSYMLVQDQRTVWTAGPDFLLFI